MRFSPSWLCAVMVAMLAASTLTHASETLATEATEQQKRATFQKEYNRQRADRRLQAIPILDGSKDERSIETLYFVSLRDPEPEVRSRAQTALVHCEDEYGYVAYLAADSFKQEKEFGVKVEKAVALGNLQYKWSALNELTEFLSTLRWSYWNWSTYNKGGGYIAAGSPPEIPGQPDASGHAPKAKDSGSTEGYDDGQKHEPLRWRSENELMGLVAGAINRLAGTQIESRPRIDQEVTKWWERKSEAWADYDRKLRTSRLPKWKDLKFKSPSDAQFASSLQPGNDTLRDMLDSSSAPVKAKFTQEAKPAEVKKSRQPMPEDE